MTRLCREAERDGKPGIVAPTGKPGSVLMFHGNLVHASPPNITPYPRKIVYVTFCAFSNHITKFTAAGMDRAPRLHADRAGRRRRAARIRPRAPRRGGMMFHAAVRAEFGINFSVTMLRAHELLFRAIVASRPCNRRACAFIAVSTDARDGSCMYTLYSMHRSGNCYKVRLALAQLGIPYDLVEIDILKGESRTPEFLAMNPSGHVPLLEVAPGRYLAESNAILWYIAGGTPLAPDDRIDRAEALQWMFFEQHSLEPNLGAAFFWLTLVKGGRELQMHALEDWMEEGYRALGVMEKHLATHDFFAAGRYTIADIALYAYTHVAHECDFDLQAFPAVRAWLNRVADQPGHVADGLASGGAKRRSRIVPHCDSQLPRVAHSRGCVANASTLTLCPRVIALRMT